MTATIPQNVSPRQPASTRVTLVYDGECPFCSRYAAMVRLRERYDLVLMNARASHRLVDEIRNLGLRLDDGMVLKVDHRYYHGDRCLNLLALMAAGSGVFSRLTKLLFSHPRIAAFAYPLLAGGRRLTLFLLGRQPMGY